MSFLFSRDSIFLAHIYAEELEKSFPLATVSTFVTRSPGGYVLSFHPQCKAEQQSLLMR